MPLLRREIEQNLLLMKLTEEAGFDSVCAWVNQWYLETITVQGRTFHGFFTMETCGNFLKHMQKSTIHTTTKRTQQPRLKERLHHLHQLIDNVSYLHQCGLVHGDLHIGNLMLADVEEGEAHTAQVIRLIDFGNSIPHAGMSESWIARYPIPEVVKAMNSRSSSNKVHFDIVKIDVFCLGILIRYLLCEEDVENTNVDVERVFQTLLGSERGMDLFLLTERTRLQDPAERPTAVDIFEEFELIFPETADDDE